MSHTVIYYHRIHFPASSGQTIQVLRDYYALSCVEENVHILYRSPEPYHGDHISTALAEYGAKITSRFRMHCIVDGWLGKWRAIGKVRECIRRSSVPIVLVVRTIDHAIRALRIRQRYGKRKIVVIIELHETAIPHMVYTENRRPVKAIMSRIREKKIFRTVDGILCNVPSQLATLEATFGDHAPCIVLPNSYDARHVGGAKGKRKKEKKIFHIKYAGQFSKWKNTGIIIEMLKYLPSNVVLDIAGGKAERVKSCERALMRQGEEHGVRDRLRYFGFLPPVKVSEFLSEGDCLVLPLGNNIQSRLFTSPMKLFEYAASNVPMVVARQPTTLGLIEDGVHALMVDPGSPADMASAVERILKDTALGCMLVKNARKWVTQHASDTRAAKLKNFFETVLTLS